MKRSGLAEDLDMKISFAALRRNDAARSTAAGVAQAFAVASQMALLYPPGLDEWMRRELGADEAGPRRRAGSRR